MCRKRADTSVFFGLLLFVGIQFLTTAGWAEQGDANRSQDIKSINPVFSFDLQRYPSYLESPSMAERALRTLARSLIAEYEKAFNRHFSLPETAPTFDYLWQDIAKDILQRKADGKLLTLAKELPTGAFERRIRGECALFIKTLVAHANFIQKRDLDDVKKRAENTVKVSEDAVAAIEQHAATLSQRTTAIDEELKTLKSKFEKQSAEENTLTINLAKLVGLSDGAIYFWACGVLASVSFVVSLLALLSARRF